MRRPFLRPAGLVGGAGRPVLRVLLHAGEEEVVETAPLGGVPVVEEVVAEVVFGGMLGGEVAVEFEDALAAAGMGGHGGDGVVGAEDHFGGVGVGDVELVLVLFLDGEAFGDHGVEALEVYFGAHIVYHHQAVLQLYALEEEAFVQLQVFAVHGELGHQLAEGLEEDALAGAAAFAFIVRLLGQHHAVALGGVFMAVQQVADGLHHVAQAGAIAVAHRLEEAVELYGGGLQVGSKEGDAVGNDLGAPYALA